jgi:hypothetical protein
MNVPIFISANVDTEKQNVPRIIKNIKESNIPLENVYIIVGGCEDNSEILIDNVRVIRVTYRCFEFTSLIYLERNADKHDFEYGFFTHDTVIFGANFYKTILNDIKNMKVLGSEAMAIETVLPSMNIGIYKKDLILLHREFLEGIIINTNDRTILLAVKHILVEYEDYILKRSKLYNNNDTSGKEEMINTTNAFGDEVTVYKRTYHRIDFVKIQTNYGFIRSIDAARIY